MSVNTLHLNQLSELFQISRNEENAIQMSKYMKGNFPFFGIKSPLRKKIMQEWWDGKSIRNEDELQFLILSLWKLDEREYQYAAVDIGKRFNKLFTPKYFRSCNSKYLFTIFSPISGVYYLSSNLATNLLKTLGILLIIFISLERLYPIAFSTSIV